MLISALVSFFKYKATRSIIILACWCSFEQIQFAREIFKHGITVTFLCEPNALKSIHHYSIQGVLYFKQSDDSVIEQLNSEHFSSRYVWLVIGKELPSCKLRYDADITLLKTNSVENYTSDPTAVVWKEPLLLQNVHWHPDNNAALHPWAEWSNHAGLLVLHERERTLRKFNLKGYPIRISAPEGLYSVVRYAGSHAQYLHDEARAHEDAAIKSGFIASELVLQLLNATSVVMSTVLWATTTDNASMISTVRAGRADLACGILRLLPERVLILDYVIPIWPFRVGFTYLAERESSSNMFVQPFTAHVWAACLVLVVVLAVALRCTARSTEEQDGAYYSALATFLQQDASAVPAGAAGRWTFLVVSVFAMLVHAYYTSAIVSGLMGAGVGGPDSLLALADSKYAIASEDYNYMRFLFFDVDSKWPELEYLKRKKRGPDSKFYQSTESGVQLLASRGTAFHAEYNQLYPLFNTFSDDQLCKVKHVDTIPEVITWVTATRHGQFFNVFRVSGAWLHETGLAKRLVSRLRAQKPPCRAQLLAERVKFGDVAPLTALTVIGALLSVVVLALEIFIAKYKQQQSHKLQDSVDALDCDD